MHAFLHQLASGFASGCIYASLALALVMIYQSTHHINFAQGEMAMFSTYLAATAIQAGVPYWVTFFGVLALSLVGGAAIHRVFIRPVEKAPVLSTVAISISLLVIFNSLAGWIWGFTSRSFPSPFDGWKAGAPYLSGHELGLVLVTLAVLSVVFAFFRYTVVGLAMRAAAQNPMASQLVGIPVGATQALGWGLAAALGSVAGMMAAPLLYLDPHLMSGLLLYAFAGALLGGITNPWGAAVGGILIGIAENLAGAYLVGTELKLVFALGVILLVLLVRPAGLFGRSTVVRV
ncbi:branched-chain amino acid ABC transporter permease [Acidovorax sp. D2M1]|uniref:Branched-chain amino acid ABC transporter permease n=1 Tax=Acidovorax benzenivorans TaxID=2987520 RepID=A0ABT5RWB5_9BURK|nr:branched-chain amino acid ABC transporter permease [Acidovorax benzenivorans]MDD2177989.1 branched-chain amino acid ABC transporter permease [Acidovorax benzenivorans]